MCIQYVIMLIVSKNCWDYSTVAPAPIELLSDKELHCFLQESVMPFAFQLPVVP